MLLEVIVCYYYGCCLLAASYHFVILVLSHSLGELGDLFLAFVLVD